MWRLAAGALVLYLVVCVAMLFGGFADRLLLHPTTEPIAAFGRREHLGGLEAFVERRGEPRALVLEFGGNAERADAGSHVVPWQNVDIWCVNYPGYGGSPGAAKLRAIPAAALAAYDALSAQAGGRPIVVFGNSIGTTAALHVAANRPVAAVVLSNPPPLRRLIGIRYGWWNFFLPALAVAAQVPAELDSVANAARARAPAVIVVAGRDEIVPPSYQERVVAAYAGQKRVVRRPEAGHNTPLDEAAAREVAEAVAAILPR